MWAKNDFFLETEKKKKKKKKKAMVIHIEIQDSHKDND